MPSIPRARQTQTIPGVSGNVQGNVSAAGAEGRGLAQVANTLSGIVEDHAAKMKQRNDLTEKVQVLTNFATESRLQIDERKKLVGEAAKDTYKNAGTWVDGYTEKVLSGIKDQQQREELRMILSNKSETFKNGAASYEAAQMKVYSTTTIDNALTEFIMQGGNGDYSGAVQGFNDVISAEEALGSLTPGEAKGRRDEGIKKITESHITGIINSDPAAVDTIKEMDFYRGVLSKDEINAYAKHAQKMVKAQEKDAANQFKEKERVAKVAKEDAQAETGNDFANKDINGTLDLTEIQNSNLEGTGQNSKVYWADRFDKRAKKVAASLKDGTPAKWVTDPAIEADIATRINTDPKSIGDTEISDTVGKGLSVDDGNKYTDRLNKALGKDEDPQKTQEAKTAYTRLREAKRDKLFSKNKADNSKEWEHASNQLGLWLDNHKDESPSDYVDQLLEPAKEGKLRSIFDFFDVFGVVDPVYTEEEKQESLDIEAGGIPKDGITTQEEFDALPSGAIFTENGQQYRKP